MKLGILSDTHNLLRPEVLEALAGVDAILHAGDISSRAVLDRLGAIAPVYAVRGNAEKEWAEDVPPFLDMELGGLHVYMTHKKKDLPQDLTPYGLVVIGHSHQYAETTQGHTLLLNPGSCGPRRFHQPITLAVVEVENGKISVSRIEITHAAPAPKIPANDLKAQIEAVIKGIEKGRSPQQIAAQYGIDSALTDLTKEDFAQTSLFAEADEKKTRSKKLDQTVDALRSKYGRTTIRRGALLKDAHEVGKKYKAQMEETTKTNSAP